MKTKAIVLSIVAGMTISITAYGHIQPEQVSGDAKNVSCQGVPSHTYTINSGDDHTPKDVKLNLFLNSDATNWCMSYKTGGNAYEVHGTMRNFGGNGADWILHSEMAKVEGGVHELFMFTSDWKILFLNFSAVPSAKTVDGDVQIKAHNGQSHGTKD